MFKKNIHYKYLLFVITFIYLITPSIYKKQSQNISCHSLKKNNYCVYQINEQKCKELEKNKKVTLHLSNVTLNRLPKDYVFLDYSYEIINSMLYTYHRDLTSSQHFQKLKNPSYTLIVYLYDGDFLNICPKSLKKFTVGNPITINGKRGTAILFNSDLVHAAAISNLNFRHCIQYKLCHKEDIQKLKHLNNQHIVKKQNKLKKPTYKDKYFSRLSHKYVLLHDIYFIGKLSEKKSNKFVTYLAKKIFNLDFYNKT